MDVRAALIRACLDNPEAETPVGVFADWLDDNGESDYAVLLRLRIALNRGEFEDKAYIDAKVREGRMMRQFPGERDPLRYLRARVVWTFYYRPRTFEIPRHADEIDGIPPTLFPTAKLQAHHEYTLTRATTRDEGGQIGDVFYNVAATPTQEFVGEYNYGVQWFAKARLAVRELVLDPPGGRSTPFLGAIRYEAVTFGPSLYEGPMGGNAAAGLSYLTPIDFGGES